MKPVFICQLTKEAQADIRLRLEIIRDTFLDLTDTDIENAMNDKISNVIPDIEWEEWKHYDYELSVYVNDDDYREKMLDEFSKYQEARRKKYGYDYMKGERDEQNRILNG